MNYIYRSMRWLEVIAFVAPALAVISIAFFWMPLVGVILSGAGLLLGFFGWLTATQNEDSSASYLLISSIIAGAALALNLTLVTGTFFQIF